MTLAAPGMVSAIALVRGDAYRPLSRPVLGRLTWLAGVIPLVLLAALKWFEPSHALDFFMSGDARNHFLMVEETRVSTR